MTRKEIVIAAVLAVVCAPFGEVVLHLLSVGAQFVGRVSTLGITTVVDAQYAMAAKSMGRPTAIPALITLVFCMGVLLALLMLSFASLASRDWVPANVFAGIRQAIVRVHVVALVLIAPILISACQSYYALQLAKAYERSAVLAAPYLSEKERLLLQAEFVTVESKSQYEVVLAKLNKAIETNKVTPAHQ